MLDYTDTQGKLKDIAVDKLFLDELNPRLGSHEARSQEEILDLLVREMSVDEVALSIAENGFYTAERLMVIERDSGQVGVYTVVEGNRRLAAVQILLDDRKRRSTKATDLPDISDERRRELQTLPVSVFASRQQIWPFLGFKHVNGPKEWDAFAKAEFVAMVHETYGVPIDEISRRIGDRFATVQRIHLGYRLVRQAEEAGVFQRTDRYNEKRFYFSHLYTAADQRPFRDFLGITDENVELPNPVPKTSLGQLGELLVWIYGSRSRGLEPIVQRQNPDLNLLRVAVTDMDAVAFLRSGGELTRASEIARGDDVVFREFLVMAKDNLLEVGKFVPLGYHGERDLFETAREIYRLSEDLLDRMETIHLRRDRVGLRRRSDRGRPSDEL